MQNKLKNYLLQKTNQQGITLVALVVTIIVLLILAGVTISLVLGQQGILDKANTSKERTDVEQTKESIKLDILNWKTEHIGEQITNSILEDIFKNYGTVNKDASGNVTGVTTELGNTILLEEVYTGTIGESTVTPSSYDAPYIPTGFIHTEGQWNTGYVIKDNEGNEFVWIPVGGSVNGTTIELKRTYFKGEDQLNQISFSETVDNSFATSVNRDGGFYIARYEASYGSGSSVADWKPLSQPSTSVLQEGQQLTPHMLWNALWTEAMTRDQMIQVCNNMYRDKPEIKSTLLNSYAYDTALTFIKAAEGKNIDTDSSAWGNYAPDLETSGTIANTGATAKAKACNIYDLAGNLWEMTTENCISYGDTYSVLRGSDYQRPGTYSAAFRFQGIPDGRYYETGFRPIIYR